MRFNRRISASTSSSVRKRWPPKTGLAKSTPAASRAARQLENLRRAQTKIRGGRRHSSHSAINTPCVQPSPFRSRSSSQLRSSFKVKSLSRISPRYSVGSMLIIRKHTSQSGSTYERAAAMSEQSIRPMVSLSIQKSRCAYSLMRSNTYSRV